MVDNKIHVHQLIYSFDVEGSGGGLSRFVIALAKALNPDLFKVSICALWNTGKPTEQEHIRNLNSMGINAITAAKWDDEKPQKSFMNAYNGLVTFVKMSNVDIIHSHSEFSDVAALLLKYRPGVPTIMRTLHNGYRLEWRKRFVRRILLTYLLYPICFDAEIGVARHVVGNMDRRLLARILGRRAVLLHNAIEIGKFNRVERIPKKSDLHMGIPDDAWVIGSVGRLREEKGFDTLLEAAAIIKQQETEPVWFLIVGAGEEEDVLKGQAKRLGIADNVIFTGPRSDVDFILSGVDLFVSASRWEGFSTAILEAMAARVPVLATDIPGNRELITAGETGWIVSANDPSALAKAITEIIKLSPELRLAVSDRAVNVPHEYSIEAVARQHEKLYIDLLQKKEAGVSKHNQHQPK